jgi:hypothetical protein
MLPADILTGLIALLALALGWLALRWALRWAVRKMHAANDRAMRRAHKKWAENGCPSGGGWSENSGDQGGMPVKPPKTTLPTNEESW